MHTRQMLKVHPGKSVLDKKMIESCVHELMDCAQTCTSCADSCLAEDNLKMLVRCIQLNLDCADICETTGRVITRVTTPSMEVISNQLQACVTACRECGQECERHAKMHEHCRICAEACRSCEKSCQEMLSSIQR